MDPAFQRRAFLVCLVLVAGLSALSVRLISLQVWDRRLSDTTTIPRFQLTQRIPARCGNIVDRNDTVLAQNRPEAALIADLNHLAAIDILIPAVARRQARDEGGWDELDEEARDKRLLQLRRKIRRTLTPEEIIAEHLDGAVEALAPRVQMSATALTAKVYAGALIPALARRQARDEEGWDQLDEEARDERLLQLRRKIRRTLTPEEIIAKHLDCAVEGLAPRIRKSAAALAAQIHSGPKRVVVRKGLREDVAREIEEALQARRIQGFSFERSQRRFYPMPNLAPHLIGFRNHKGEGELGLEKSMHEILVGRDGERTLKRDENGLVNLTEPAKVTPPKMGKHVRITLDMGMQAIVEEELGMAFEFFEAKHGSIVVVDPHTGDILAMASRPHFNLNLRKNYQNAATSFAVSAQYEAGSVMKIVAMAAALDEPNITRETVVNCGWGELYRYGVPIPDHSQFGDLSFDRVLMKSSNTGVFQFADMLGRQKFYEALYDFGFCRPTGFRIPGEVSGQITDPTNMWNYSRATFGYTVSVTPLQLAMAYSVLANGGTLLKPRLVDAIIANNGVILDRTPVRQVRRVISEETAKKMCLALGRVVEHGTGESATVKGYRAGGKTGTAKKWNPALKNGEGDYDPFKKFLTFAGFLPVDDPKFVCVVTIDEPYQLRGKAPENSRISGSAVAGPIFSAVAGRVANLMNLPRTEEPVALNPSEQ